jgi:hypothetical protein
MPAGASPGWSATTASCAFVNVRELLTGFGLGVGAGLDGAVVMGGGAAVVAGGGGGALSFEPPQPAAASATAAKSGTSFFIKVIDAAGSY